MVLFRVKGKEMLDQRQDILGSFPERLDVYGNDIQTIVQILPEFSLPDHLGEIDIGGRHDPHVHRYGRRPAKALDLPVLEGVQQFRLDLQGDFADLVEEHGPVAGDFEHSLLALGAGVRESPSFISEKLRFQQGGRKGGAVDFHERPQLLPGTVFMYVFRDDVFSHAGFARNENGRVGPGHPPGEKDRPPEFGALRDHRGILVRRDFSFQGLQFLLEVHDDPLGTQEILLDPAQFRDVPKAADDAHESAPPDHDGGRRYEDLLPARVGDHFASILQILDDFQVDSLGDPFFLDHVEGVLPDHLLPIDAGDPLEGGVGVDVVSLPVDDEDAILDRFDDGLDDVQSFLSRYRHGCSSKIFFLPDASHGGSDS